MFGHLNDNEFLSHFKIHHNQFIHLPLFSKQRTQVKEMWGKGDILYTMKVTVIAVDGQS